MPIGGSRLRMDVDTTATDLKLEARRTTSRSAARVFSWSIRDDPERSSTRNTTVDVTPK